MDKIAAFFKVKERGSTVGTEVVGGLTTFLAMAYIIAVNPSMMVVAGIPFDAALTATCFGAAVMTIAMGLIANRPLALASGMGINAIVAYTLCLGEGAVDWRVAMAVVMLEGLVILILVLCGLRKAVMDAIPVSLRRAIGIGIGLFIAFIGLKGGGLVVGDDSTLVALGDLTSGPCIVALASIVIAVGLQAANVKGGLVISIVLATIIGIPLGVTQLPTSWNFGLDFSAFAAPLQTDPTTGTMALFQVFLQPTLLLMVFSLLMSDFFDTMGTVVAVGKRADFVDAKGDVEDIQEIPDRGLHRRCRGRLHRRKLHHHLCRVHLGCGCRRAYRPLEHRDRRAVCHLCFLCPGHRHGGWLGYLRCPCGGGLPHALRRDRHRLGPHRERLPRVHHHRGHPHDLLDHQRYRPRLHLLLLHHGGPGPR